MEFKIQWVNDNVLPSVVRVYRATAAMTYPNLPDPIATFSNGESEFIDPTVEYGQTYYYLLTVTAGGKTIPTLNRKFTAVLRRGIGPATLQYGDDRFGYFGPVDDPDEQWYIGDVFAGVYDLWNGSAGVAKQTLDKWLLDGKIYYTVTSGRFVINAAVTWDALYKLGMVYGTDDAGPENGRGDLSAVVQNAGITHLGDRYRVKCPSGWGDDSFDWAAYTQPTPHDDYPNTPRNLYNDLMYNYTNVIPLKQRFIKPRYMATNYLSGANTSYADWGNICQEREPGGDRVLCRGMWRGAASAVLDTDPQLVYLRRASDSGVFCPIIELVE